MTPEIALDLSRQAVLVVLQVAGPMLVVSMAVGLVVSVLQAATQIHEATLSFVPKVLAILAALLLLGGFMIQVLVGFTVEIFRVVAERM